MKSVIMAVWLFSVSLGNFVTAAVNHAIQVPSINPIVAEAGTLEATEGGGSDMLADRTIRVVDVEPRKSWATADEATVVRTIRLAGGDGSFDTPDDVLLSFNRFASLVGVDTQEDEALTAAKEIDPKFEQIGQHYLPEVKLILDASPDDYPLFKASDCYDEEKTTNNIYENEEDSHLFVMGGPR